MQAQVEGQLKVFFYDTEAGAKNISSIVVPARSTLYSLDVSNLSIPWDSERCLPACQLAPGRIPHALPGIAHTSPRSDCCNSSHSACLPYSPWHSMCVNQHAGLDCMHWYCLPSSVPLIRPSGHMTHDTLLCAQVVVDASNVPNRYAVTILSECAAFPRRLVFFLKGHLTVSESVCMSPCSDHEAGACRHCILISGPLCPPLPLPPFLYADYPSPIA